MQSRTRIEENKSIDLKGVNLLLFRTDASSLKKLETSLNGLGANVFLASSEGDALKMLSSLENINVIAAPCDTGAKEFCEAAAEYKSRHRETLFYLFTKEGYGDIEEVSEKVTREADDYVNEPIDPERFTAAIATNIKRPYEGTKSLTVIEPIVARVKPYFIFRSSAMKRALWKLPEISVSGQPVLITGQTGTGKELVARAVHILSRRPDGPFVPLNCGAVPESLIEGELFGYEKGSFTGAYRVHKGKFESADKGTLFLDEIGEMPLNMQVRLLRALEEGRIYRLGSEKPLPVDVRVIAATNINLGKALEDGLFRPDLYYRINVLRITLPPLFERAEDIPLLALHFLERAFHEMGRIPPYPELSSETIHILVSYPWRGNVRELRNVMTRVATFVPAGVKRIFPFHIVPHLEGPREQKVVSSSSERGVFIPSGASIKEAENILIKEALNLTHGSRVEAARILGISVRTLSRKIKV